MGLLDNAEGTKEEKLYVIKKDLTKDSSKLYRKMISAHTTIFNKVWNNSEASAQDIFDEYGTDAAELFVFSQNIQTLLAQAGLNYTPMSPPFPYTINEDGTVTVHYPIEDPSSGEVAPESRIF